MQATSNPTKQDLVKLNLQMQSVAQHEGAKSRLMADARSDGMHGARVLGNGHPTPWSCHVPFHLIVQPPPKTHRWITVRKLH